MSLDETQARWCGKEDADAEDQQEEIETWRRTCHRTEPLSTTTATLDAGIVFACVGHARSEE